GDQAGIVGDQPQPVAFGRPLGRVHGRSLAGRPFGLRRGRTGFSVVGDAGTSVAASAAGRSVAGGPLPGWPAAGTETGGGGAAGPFSPSLLGTKSPVTRPRWPLAAGAGSIRLIPLLRSTTAYSP